MNRRRRKVPFSPKEKYVHFLTYHKALSLLQCDNIGPTKRFNHLDFLYWLFFMLLDIGANIGTHTLAALQNGNK